MLTDPRLIWVREMHLSWYFSIFILLLKGLICSYFHFSYSDLKFPLPLTSEFPTAFTLGFSLQCWFPARSAELISYCCKVSFFSLKPQKREMWTIDSQTLQSLHLCTWDNLIAKRGRPTVSLWNKSGDDGKGREVKKSHITCLQGTITRESGSQCWRRNKASAGTGKNRQATHLQK